MAKLNQKILGKVSGSLGDITFRQRNGKNYIASRPSKFNAPQDKISLDRRSKFALAVKIASVINSIPQLKTVWASKIPAGITAYNYLVKTNYKCVDPATVNESTFLTPSFGFGLSVVSSGITSSDITIVTEALGTRAGIDLQIEKNIQLFALLCLSEPLNENLDRTSLVPLVSDSQILVLDAQITVNLPLTSQCMELLNKYSVKKVISGLITFDTDNNPVHYSNTVIIESTL